jgi:hypothetical protein
MCEAAFLILEGHYNAESPSICNVSSVKKAKSEKRKLVCLPHTVTLCFPMNHGNGTGVEVIFV